VSRLAVAAALARPVAALAIVLAVPAATLGQVPAAGLSVHKEKASGIEAQFVNYPWRPDVFQTMTLTGWNDGATLTIRYGNRKLTKDLVRAMP
jgi:hypothetical protein